MRLNLMGTYFGPDQLMPVASILATAAGLILIFRGKLVGIVRHIRGLYRHSAEEAPVARATDKRPSEQR